MSFRLSVRGPCFFVSSSDFTCHNQFVDDDDDDDENVKKLQFIHKLTASDTSKTAKITKR